MEARASSPVRSAISYSFCVNVYPGKAQPSASLATFTFTVGASGAFSSAGRITANCVNTSLKTRVTR